MSAKCYSGLVPVKTQDFIQITGRHLVNLADHTFDVLTLERPGSVAAAAHLAKMFSKLSPLATAPPSRALTDAPARPRPATVGTRGGNRLVNASRESAIP